MISVFTERDLKAAIEAYIKHREITGLSRDTALFGAIEETKQAVQLRHAVANDQPLRILDEHKRQTDKLPAVDFKL